MDVFHSITLTRIWMKSSGIPDGRLARRVHMLKVLVIIPGE